MTDIKEYRVKLTYLYSDTVRVSAKSQQEAIDLAQEIVDEQYEAWYDAEVTEL